MLPCLPLPLYDNSQNSEKWGFPQKKIHFGIGDDMVWPMSLGITLGMFFTEIVMNLARPQFSRWRSGRRGDVKVITSTAIHSTEEQLVISIPESFKKKAILLPTNKQS